MVQQEFDCATHELRPSGQFDHARSPVPILDLIPDDDDDDGERYRFVSHPSSSSSFLSHPLFKALVRSSWILPVPFITAVSKKKETIAVNPTIVFWIYQTSYYIYKRVNQLDKFRFNIDYYSRSSFNIENVTTFGEEAKICPIPNIQVLIFIIICVSIIADDSFFPVLYNIACFVLFLFTILIIFLK